jgi:hypothetical protein
LEKLLQLEAESWPEEMRHSKSLIQERILLERIFVLEMDGNGVVGSITAQRIESVESIFAQSWATEDLLVDLKGNVLQLLRVNTLLESAPLSARMLPVGAILRDFCLRYAKQNHLNVVCAVTKTTNYCAGSSSYATYVSQKVDAGVNFHLSRGASLKCVVPNWRPEDVANEGFGVLVAYELEGLFDEVQNSEIVKKDEDSKI